MRLANTEVEDIQISYTDEYWYCDLLNKGNKMMLINKDTIEKERNARLQDVLAEDLEAVKTDTKASHRKEMERLTTLIEALVEAGAEVDALPSLIARRIVLREAMGE